MKNCGYFLSTPRNGRRVVRKSGLIYSVSSLLIAPLPVESKCECVGDRAEEERVLACLAHFRVTDGRKSLLVTASAEFISLNAVTAGAGHLPAHHVHDLWAHVHIAHELR